MIPLLLVGRKTFAMDGFGLVILVLLGNSLCTYGGSSVECNTIALSM